MTKGGYLHGAEMRVEARVVLRMLDVSVALVLPANGRVKLALTLPMFRMTPDRRLTMSLPTACMVAERRHQLAYA